nr:uncharacterized protein LOC105473997 isoform X5 [Macaca nemestrina]
MSKNGLDYFIIQKTRTKAGHHTHLCRPACLCGVDLRVCVLLFQLRGLMLAGSFATSPTVQELCIHLTPFPWHCMSLLWALIIYFTCARHFYCSLQLAFISICSFAILVVLSSCNLCLDSFHPVEPPLVQTVFHTGAKSYPSSKWGGLWCPASVLVVWRWVCVSGFCPGRLEVGMVSGFCPGRLEVGCFQLSNFPKRHSSPLEHRQESSASAKCPLMSMELDNDQEAAPWSLLTPSLISLTFPLKAQGRVVLQTRLSLDTQARATVVRLPRALGFKTAHLEQAPQNWEETRFLRLPKVLILQVRELTFENGRFHKIQKPINIAQVLKLHTSPRELTLPKCKASHSGTLTPNPPQSPYRSRGSTTSMPCAATRETAAGATTQPWPSPPAGRSGSASMTSRCTVGPEFPLHHTFRSETPYLLLYRCQDTEDRQEPEAPGPDNGDMRTMTDVAVPKEKVPCPGVEGETLKTDSATVCWGGHSQSLSPLRDDKPICHRQSPAKKYRRDMEPGLGDRGRASEHVDEEGPKAPPPGEQGEARGLPCGPQCSPEEELPAVGMRSSAAEDQALSHPVQGPAQPGKTPSCFGEAAATYVSSPSLTSLPGPHHWLTPSPSHFPRSVSSTHYPASLDVAFGDPCSPQGGRPPIVKLSRASPRPDSHPGSSSPAELEAEQGVLGGEAGQSRVGSPGLSSHALSTAHMRMEPTFSKQLQTDSGHEDRKISADQENSEDEGWTMRRDRSASEGSELQGTGWP